MARSTRRRTACGVTPSSSAMDAKVEASCPRSPNRAATAKALVSSRWSSRRVDPRAGHQALGGFIRALVLTGDHCAERVGALADRAVHRLGLAEHVDHREFVGESGAVDRCGDRGAQFAAAMAGNPDGGGRRLESTLDRLADPPRCVGRELVAAPPIELLHGLFEADHAVLHDVVTVEVDRNTELVGDALHETHVRLDEVQPCAGALGDECGVAVETVAPRHTVGGGATRFDRLGQPAFVRCGQECSMISAWPSGVHG